MQIHQFEQTSAAQESESHHHSAPEKVSLTRLFDPSFVLAAVLTGVYYGIVLQPSMHDTLLHRYTTEHVVEYAIVALFFWGLVDIVIKCVKFPRELRSLRQEWLPPSRGREPVGNAVALLDRLCGLPRSQQDSRLGRFQRELLEFVIERRSGKDCRDYHRQLMEREDERVHSDYTLLRFIVAVTPILGFLGTVVHFGTALSGMSFDEMTEKLPMVVAEMGMAFNTTTVALAAAMFTMFAMFLCERIDRGILHSAEKFVERELVTRFEDRQQGLDPFLNVLKSVHEEALDAFSNALLSHADRWAGKMDALLERFDAHQLQSVTAWQNALTSLQQQHAAYTEISEVRVQDTLELMESAENRHMETIQTMLEEAASFRDELAGFAKTLDAFARGEGKLVEVQETLAENLLTLHQSRQIDEALHGLTAAIHLLTVRHNPGGLGAAA